MPSYEHIRVNELDDATSAWFENILSTIETLDVDAYVALMVDDVALRLPDGTVLRGKADVARTLGQAWADVAHLEHQERNIWGDPRQVVHEARVTVETRQGAIVTTTSTSWIDRDQQGQITSARVYG